MSVQGGYTEFPTLISPLWIQRPKIGMVVVKGLFEPFGSSPKTNEFNQGKSDHWVMIITTFGLQNRDAERLMSFCLKVGLYGKVAIQPTLFLPPGSDGERISQPNPLVNGASQTGNGTINYDGATPSTSVIEDGQFFQIDKQLLQCNLDENSNVSGIGTIKFSPNLRSSPANDAVIDINTPFLHALLLNLPEVDIVKGAKTPPITLAFMEDI